MFRSTDRQPCQQTISLKKGNIASSRYRLISTPIFKIILQLVQISPSFNLDGGFDLDEGFEIASCRQTEHSFEN